MLANPKTRDGAIQAIRKYGRFSEPILKRILVTEKDPAARARINELINRTADKAS
jgi:hypothetical protein